jgi:hypothetical protein
VSESVAAPERVCRILQTESVDCRGRACLQLADATPPKAERDGAAQEVGRLRFAARPARKPLWYESGYSKRWLTPADVRS